MTRVTELAKQIQGAQKTMKRLAVQYRIFNWLFVIAAAWLAWNGHYRELIAMSLAWLAYAVVDLLLGVFIILCILTGVQGMTLGRAAEEHERSERKRRAAAQAINDAMRKRQQG